MPPDALIRSFTGPDVRMELEVGIPRGLSGCACQLLSSGTGRLMGSGKRILRAAINTPFFEGDLVIGRAIF